MCPRRVYPHVYVVLLILILLACLMTYIVPAGQFGRVYDEASGQTLVIAGSFEYAERTGLAPWLMERPRHCGMVDPGDPGYGLYCWPAAFFFHLTLIPFPHSNR